MRPIARRSLFALITGAFAAPVAVADDRIVHFKFSIAPTAWRIDPTTWRTINQGAA